MTESEKTCFIAMPITTHSNEVETYRGDSDHWMHVMDHLFVPAIEAAGFHPVKPISKGSAMIHADIVKRLETCDLVLCDLSGKNPNVFFELGVRTSLDKPIAIVRDDKTRIPFDLGGTNVHEYFSELNPWTLSTDVGGIAQHLRDAEITCNGTNPLWQQYGLTIRAQEPSVSASPIEAKIDLLVNRMATFENDIEIKAASPGAGHRTPNLSLAERMGVTRQGAGQIMKRLERWCAQVGRGATLWVSDEGVVFQLDRQSTNAVPADAFAELSNLLARTNARIQSSDWTPSPADGWARVESFPPF